MAQSRVRAAAAAPRVCDLFNEDSEWQLGPLAAICVDDALEPADEGEGDEDMEGLAEF